MSPILGMVLLRSSSLTRRCRPRRLRGREDARGLQNVGERGVPVQRGRVGTQVQNNHVAGLKKGKTVMKCTQGKLAFT